MPWFGTRSPTPPRPEKLQDLQYFLTHWSDLFEEAMSKANESEVYDFPDFTKMDSETSEKARIKKLNDLQVQAIKVQSDLGFANMFLEMADSCWPEGKSVVNELRQGTKDLISMLAVEIEVCESWKSFRSFEAQMRKVQSVRTKRYELFRRSMDRLQRGFKLVKELTGIDLDS